MKRVSTVKFIKIFVLILIGLVTNAQSVMLQDKPISRGEELQYSVSYGWLAIGKGTFKISDEYVIREGKECVEININGITVGLAGAISKVDDRWGAIIDKNTLLPHYSYRNLVEGDYDLDERIYFNYDSMNVRVERSSTKDSEKSTRYFDFSSQATFDMIGGLMHARSIEYKGLNRGDTIRFDAFFDKRNHVFEIIYHGVEMTKTKVGSVYCHKLAPVMQKNGLFKGKNSVKLWISADMNRLPLKVISTMNFGTIYTELTSYKNIKNGVDFLRLEPN